MTLRKAGRNEFGGSFMKCRSRLQSDARAITNLACAGGVPAARPAAGDGAERAVVVAPVGRGPASVRCPAGQADPCYVQRGQVRRRGHLRHVEVESDFALRAVSAAAARVDNAMVKALARAFRWRKQLDGACMPRSRTWPGQGRERDLCQPVLRLTLLAPEIVEAILDGRQPAGLQLDDLLEGFPLEWVGQRQAKTQKD